MGLFLRESSPSMTVSPSNMELIPANILMVVPEFSAFTCPGACRSPPSIVHTPSFSETFAPIATHAARVALASADMSALETRDVPSAMDARKNALCVWLLDGGGEVLPSSLPPLNAIEVIRRTSSL